MEGSNTSSSPAANEYLLMNVLSFFSIATDLTRIKQLVDKTKVVNMTEMRKSNVNVKYDIFSELRNKKSEVTETYIKLYCYF